MYIMNNAIFNQLYLHEIPANSKQNTYKLKMAVSIA